MGRSLRLDPPGAWHHVMNRGVARQDVFLAAGDGRAFESLLADGFQEFGVEVHAYCLMNNHFHLLVRCPEGGLSTYMQRLGARYTRHLNHRLARDGPIFRGRFRSILIDSDQYLCSVGRYIHRNPLDLRPPVDLAEYRWSSYRSYCGMASAPPWLHLSTLLAMHEAGSYREFVEDDHVDAPGSLEWAIATAIGEYDDFEIVVRPGCDRTIAVAMLDMAEGPVTDRLEAALSFPSPGARHEAIRRARRRSNTHPVLGRVARRALDLAA